MDKQMIRDNSCIVKNEKLVADRRSIAHHQGVNYAQLGLQRRENCRPRPRLPRLAQWPLAQNDVIAVEHFEATMQYLEDRPAIFLIVRRGSDQLSADGERLDEPAAVEIHGQLRAFGFGV